MIKTYHVGTLMKHIMNKKTVTILFCSFLLELMACRNISQRDMTPVAYTYVPTFREITENEATVRSAFLCGDVLVYETYMERENLSGLQTFFTLSLTEESSEPQPIAFQFPNGWGSVVDIIRDNDGNYYTLENDSTLGIMISESMMKPGFCVGKYDAEGKRIASWNITDRLLENGGELQAQGLMQDAEGNICICGQNSILLLNKEGDYKGKIMEQGILYMVCGADGSIYYDASDLLKKLDSDTVESETIAENFPSGTGMCLGDETDLWVYNINGIYRYETENRMPELLYSWLDMNVEASNLAEMTRLGDDKLVLLLYDRMDRKAQSLQLVFLAKTEGIMDTKETITVGVMTITDTLRSAAIRFNQEHPEYHVQLKEYMGLNGYRSYEDAIAAMDRDLVAGKVADIISVGYEDLGKYVSKDMLVDLTPYLNNSEVLSEENLVDTVVEAYTFDDRLVALPSWFRLEVIAGRQSQIGAQSGWSVADMISFFDRYEDAQVLKSLSPNEMLETCMKCNLEYFIDEETGDCHFDSQEFSEILSFAGHFMGQGSTFDWQRINQENGQLLLYKAWCVTPEFVVEIPQWFDDEAVNYIGYPTMDGKSGILLEPTVDAYGILANSAHKEIAWAFLESVIQAEGERNDTFDNTSGIFDTRFPIMQDKLELQLAASLENPYELDEQGEILRDKEGKSVRRCYGTINYVNLGMEMVRYIPLPEEVEQVRDLIAQARIAPGYREAIMNIIQEEAASYFIGDKKIEEVTEIIQNRVNVYLKEMN